MVRQGAFRQALAAIVVLGAMSASAGANQLTGYVDKDFPLTKPDGTASGIVLVPHSLDPFHLGQPDWMTKNGLVGGWSIKDVRFGYDSKTDTLYVGVGTFGEKA